MNRDVLAAVFEHARKVDEWCARNGGIRIVTALFGSQNYGLATTDSDVDTKSIIIPELNDWIWGDIDKYNKTIEMSDGSHAETKALSEMCKQYIKGNINFLETLYTDYVDIAPGWEWIYNQLIGVRDNISRNNMFRTGKSWIGYCRQALERACESTSVSLGYREDVGYNPKSLMNAFRIKETFIRFFQFNRPFDEAMNMSDMRGMLLDIKESPMPFDVAWQYAKDLYQWTDKAEKYLYEHYTDKQVFNTDFWCKCLCKTVYVVVGEDELTDPEPDERPRAKWQDEVGDWPNSNLKLFDI